MGKKRIIIKTLDIQLGIFIAEVYGGILREITNDFRKVLEDKIKEVFKNAVKT